MLGGESGHNHTDSSVFDGGRQPFTRVSDCCRSLLYHRRVLVRLQSRAGLLRPVLRRHEVSDPHAALRWSCSLTRSNLSSTRSHVCGAALSCGRRFELGTGLFLGWGGASLSLLGGGLLCSACRRATPEGKKGYRERVFMGWILGFFILLTSILKFRILLFIKCLSLCGSGYYGNAPAKVYTVTAKSDPDSGRAYV